MVRLKLRAATVVGVAVGRVAVGVAVGSVPVGVSVGTVGIVGTVGTVGTIANAAAIALCGRLPYANHSMARVSAPRLMLTPVRTCRERATEFAGTDFIGMPPFGGIRFQ